MQEFSVPIDYLNGALANGGEGSIRDEHVASDNRTASWKMGRHKGDTKRVYIAI